MSNELLTLWQEAFEAILMTLISTLLPIITYQVIKIVQAQGKRIESEIQKNLSEFQKNQTATSNSIMDALNMSARAIVAAIEQEAVKQAVARTKEQMKQEAMKRLEYTMTSVLGFSGITSEVFSDAIEAALREGAHRAFEDVKTQDQGTTTIQLT